MATRYPTSGNRNDGRCGPLHVSRAAAALLARRGRRGGRTQVRELSARHLSTDCSLPWHGCVRLDALSGGAALSVEQGDESLPGRGLHECGITAWVGVRRLRDHTEHCQGMPLELVHELEGNRHQGVLHRSALRSPDVVPRRLEAMSGLCPCPQVRGPFWTKTVIMTLEWLQLISSSSRAYACASPRRTTLRRPSMLTGTSPATVIRRTSRGCVSKSATA